MRALSVALSLLLLSACASEPTTLGGPIAIHLSGTTWRRVDDRNANPHGATLEFAENRASGFTGCNRWFATVTQDGEELRFGDVGTTRMACAAEPAAAAERNFLNVLSATRDAHYDGEVLVLLDAEQNVIARFDRND